jgi:hypothetical protein
VRVRGLTPCAFADPRHRAFEGRGRGRGRGRDRVVVVIAPVMVAALVNGNDIVGVIDKP